jgi:hypothetical protein
MGMDDEVEDKNKLEHTARSEARFHLKRILHFISEASSKLKNHCSSICQYERVF